MLKEAVLAFVAVGKAGIQLRQALAVRAVEQVGRRVEEDRSIWLIFMPLASSLALNHETHWSGYSGCLIEHLGSLLRFRPIAMFPDGAVFLGWSFPMDDLQ